MEFMSQYDARIVYVKGEDNMVADALQGGSGIRMLDRTPVGWLPPEARKKKMDIINFFAL
jgi:hypothetical protein